MDNSSHDAADSDYLIADTQCAAHCFDLLLLFLLRADHEEPHQDEEQEKDNDHGTGTASSAGCCC